MDYKGLIQLCLDGWLNKARGCFLHRVNKFTTRILEVREAEDSNHGMLADQQWEEPERGRTMRVTEVR